MFIDELALPGYFQYSLAIVVGLIVGSFLNVVIHRLPVMIFAQWRRDCQELLATEADPATAAGMDKYNLMWPPSSCPACGHKIRPYENIPIISYLLLKGRCSSCGVHISLRYPMIEALTSILTLAVVIKFGMSLTTAYVLLFTYSMICISFIDIDHQIIPDAIIYPLLWLGMLITLFPPSIAMRDSLIGAASGWLSLWFIYHIFLLATGKEGMGYGDFKLFALIGAWTGWQLHIQTIILSSLAGAVIGISLIIFRKHDKSIPIPFGPYLAIAGWISLMFGDITSGLISSASV